MAVKDLIGTDVIIQLAEAARIVMAQSRGYKMLTDTRLFTVSDIHALRVQVENFLEVVNLMDGRQLADEIETEKKRKRQVTINLDRHLDPLGFLITIEVARLVLGDKARREWVLASIGLDNNAADEVCQRLSRLMAEVRATEKQIPNSQNKTIPALESGFDAHAL
jgi:hypothetical protein